MEADVVFRDYVERQRRLQERLADIQRKTESILTALAERQPGIADAQQLDNLRLQREKVVQDYQKQAGTFVGYLRKVEESNRRSEMVEKRTRPQRSQAKIEKLSEELTTKLRLERVDHAIRELLEFLEDAEFFAANATVGRKRKLRMVQGGIEKALAK